MTALSRSRSLVLVLVVLFAASGCSSDEADPSSTSTAVSVTTSTAAPAAEECAPWLEEMVAATVEAAGLVGVAAAVVTPECVEQVAVGYSDLEDQVPLEVDETFRIGSISKTITAALAVRLAEEGYLSLDDPVADHVDGDFGDITIEQLLSHTSGLTDFDWESNIWDYLRDPSAIADRLGALDAALASSARIDPGSIQRYANVNYLAAGLVIEAASGSSFEAALEEFVTGPLGIESTSVESSATELPGHYIRMTPTGDPIPLGDLPTGLGSIAAWSAGGMVSTLDDLTAFVEAPFADEIVSAESLAVMTEGSDGARSGYGLGMDVSSVGGAPVYGHNGWVIGFVSAFHHTPEAEVTVVVLSNDGAADSPSLADSLLARALDPAG